MAEEVDPLDHRCETSYGKPPAFVAHFALGAGTFAQGCVSAATFNTGTPPPKLPHTPESVHTEPCGYHGAASNMPPSSIHPSQV